MRFFALSAAFLSLYAANAQAAQYLYQANPYTAHSGSCGNDLLPFQMTITVQKAMSRNATNIGVALKAIEANGGEKYQWRVRYTKDTMMAGLFQQIRMAT